MRSLLFIALVISVSNLFAQTPFTCVQLPPPSIASKFYGQCEPAIAINPINPKIMAAGAILNDYYYSTDGGKNWKSKVLKSPYGVWGDPVMLFDYKGRVYYFHLSNYKKATWIDRIICQSAPAVDKPFDEGTFPKPNGTKAQDKHWAAVDPKNNTLYLTWTQFDKYDSKLATDSSVILFSKSTNQGKNWSEPTRISFYGGDCEDGDNTVEGAVPVVGPNGEIYVTWTGPRGLVFQCSFDGGNSWLPKEQLIMPHPGGWVFDIPGMNRANGLPILTCDNSNGPNRGTLYLNWCDQRNGTTDTDVWVSASKDGGKSWSDPTRVNQDTSKHHQFFTWMAVDQSTGYLYFVYYDRRNHADETTDVFLSVSTDGGQSFSDVRISDKPFKPREDVFFGDYLNIAAVNGVIRPIWPRMDDGKITLFVTLIEQNELLKSIAR